MNMATSSSTVNTPPDLSAAIEEEMAKTVEIVSREENQKERIFQQGKLRELLRAKALAELYKEWETQQLR